MMDSRCSSCQAVGGSCSCGCYHNPNNSFSMVFSAVPTHDGFGEYGDMYRYSSSPPSSVDCTLSLGTPSTRVSNNEREKRRSSSVSKFCSWNFLQTSKSNESSSHKSNRGASNSNFNYSGGSDALSARRCANCDTTSTPLWRNGPKGPKSLCNACGIRYKKEERRAAAASASAANNGDSGNAAIDAHHMLNSSWVPYFSSAYGNEFRFIEDYGDNHDSDTGVSYLSWHLNVADRPGLVHNFTR